ncbi:hypothetical protein FJT64_015089 [Amphibalanus amphitrite]|uniref:Uncharacterized protein n=1 Tax=Amphibalanus amphitrite TaxID=1232801 RepID=A0A6A4XEI9_AMPAM|nr:hypothetical protein FJT64_015089 [Amphibalanus amphitrite]
MIGRPAPSAAAIGPSAVEELVEAALTGAVALLLWTGLRRVVGVAAPVLWSRARRLVSFKPSHQTGDSPLSDEATTSADDTTDRVVGSVQPVMCSVAGSRGPAASQSGAAAAVDGGRPPDRDGATQARPVFEAQGVSFGDGVVISDEGVTSGVLDQNGVTMSEVGVDQSAPTNVQCSTDGFGCDTDVADDAVVPRTEQDCDSDVSDEVNPCNQTFYSEGDGDDADAECDENEYDLGEHQPEQDDDYDDWFAVSNDDEIRTTMTAAGGAGGMAAIIGAVAALLLLCLLCMLLMKRRKKKKNLDELGEEEEGIATADLQPFYEDTGSAEPGRRPAAMFHLAGDLSSEPDFIEGYSCLETIVEENSDDMRSDSDSLRSGPASRDWSEDSDGQDGTTSPSALTAGPPGWTWCLEPSDSTGAADDWGSEEECEPKPRLRRASAGDELMEADGLGHGRLMSWDQPLTKSCVGAPLFSELPPARPLAATTSAAWRQSPELLSQMAPLSHSDFRGHHWRVDNEPISAELSCAGPGGRRHSDPGTFGGRIGLPVTLAEPSDGRDDRSVTGGRPVSPQGHRRSPERPAPTPRSGCGGSDAPAIGHDPTTGGLGAARNAQLAASTAERCAVSVERAAVTSTPAGARGGTEAPEATEDGRVPTAADPKWDLGSCEDFENLDRRIESLTFDFEEEERTLQTLESLESATDVQRRRYQRLSSSRQASTEEPNQLCEPVRRFHSSGDLTMISDDARSERPAARRSTTKTTQIDGDSNSPQQTNISTPETTVPRSHARVELLRHSSENLSEDSGFGEQTVGARSSSEASSPPPSLSLTTPREESSGQPETAPSRLSRRSQSTPDLSPSAQRRRRLLELIGRDERRRARVYLDAAASDARDAAGLDAAAQPTVPRRQLSLETASGASKERPVPAPRSAPPKPAAVYQNVPPNAWLAALAAGDGKEAVRRTTQVNGSSGAGRGPDPAPDPAPDPGPPADSGMCSGQRAGAVAARPTPTTRGIARATTDTPLDRDAGDCGDAADNGEARSWGRPEPAAPPAPASDLPRLHGPGMGYPDWLDTSMEPADTGETSSVGGFFSRVAVSAAPPDAVRLPGLISGSDGSVRRGDGAGVRRQVVTCERAAADTTQPRTDAAEMERRERRTNGGLTTPPAAPRAAAERPRTMMERLGLGRLSGTPSGDTATDVREAFERFRRQAQEDRARLALSTPDLSLIETTTKQLVRPPSPDPRPRPVEVTTFGHDDSYEIEWGESTSTVRPARGSAHPSPAARAWPKVPAARTHAEENLPCKETDLDAIVRGLQQFIDEISPPREKAKSMLNLEEAEQLGRSSATSDSRAKSMEFLLDDENKATTLPPENQLMRGGEAARQLSRHELRFQRSLRNLHTPEWYRRAAVAPTAALRRNLDNASLQGGWSGLSSKSNSKESLPTSSAATPTPGAAPRRLALVPCRP